MQKRHVFKAAVAAAVAALLVVPAALAAASKPAKVTVRVEGKTRTLLAVTAVTTKAGSITRGGAPAGVCPSTTAQGALQDATHGRWTGSWSNSYKEYYLTGILGDTEATAKAYWAIYVNGKYATSGACEIALKSGDSLLFAVVPGKGKTPLALGATLPAKGAAGSTVTPKVFYYDAKGVKHPLVGASVTLKGTVLTTKAGGVTTPITLTGKGTETLEVSKSGYVRTEATIRVS